MLRAENVFGDRIQGGTKQSGRKADQAYKELQTTYEAVALAPPINLRRELTPPLDLGGLVPEITPAEYTYVAKSDADTKTLTVRSPMTWVLSYKGFEPPRFQQLLASKMRSPQEVQRFVAASIVMNLVVRHQPGISEIFEAIRFPITTTTVPELGELPITRIGVGVTTERPADAVVIESAELTGMNAFEEVVNVGDIQDLRDPLKEQLLALTQQYGPDLMALQEKSTGAEPER